MGKTREKSQNYKSQIPKNQSKIKTGSLMRFVCGWAGSPQQDRVARTRIWPGHHCHRVRLHERTRGPHHQVCKGPRPERPHRVPRPQAVRQARTRLRCDSKSALGAGKAAPHTAEASSATRKPRGITVAGATPSRGQAARFVHRTTWGGAAPGRALATNTGLGYGCK